MLAAAEVSFKNLSATWCLQRSTQWRRYVLDEVAGNNHAYLVDNVIRASAEVEALLAPGKTSGPVPG